MANVTLPTVKIRNRKTGDIRIINASDYQRDIAGMARDWEIVSVRDVTDATKEDLKRDDAENDGERARRERGADNSAERQSGENAIVVSNDTAEAMKTQADAATSGEAGETTREPDPVEALPDLDTMVGGDIDAWLATAASNSTVRRVADRLPEDFRNMTLTAKREAITEAHASLTR